MELGCHAFLVVGTGVQHLRKDLELDAYFRALELGCRTGVPSEIGTPVPTMACDLKKKHPNRYRYVQVHKHTYTKHTFADEDQTHVRYGLYVAVDGYAFELVSLCAAHADGGQNCCFMVFRFILTQISHLAWACRHIPKT